MPFCENCGRRLAENEECNCKSNPAPQPAPVPPPMGQPQPTVYNTVIQQPKKKSGVGVVILIIAIVLILVVLVVGGILAAILVPSMVGYTKKSKFQSANSASSSICKAANASFTEMDDDGYELDGYFILSSDSSYNYNVPSGFDTNEFYYLMNTYFDAADECKWFVVAENGYVSYAAQSDSWNGQYTGSYPAGSNFTPRYYNDSTLTTNEEKRTLNTLYSDAVDKVYYLASSSYYYY